MNSSCWKFGKLWKSLRKLFCWCDPPPLPDWSPGISQGPSKLQLRAVTILLEQEGGGCAPKMVGTGRAGDQIKTSQGWGGCLEGWVRVVDPVAESQSRGHTSQRSPGRLWGGDGLKYNRALALPYPISPGPQGRQHSGVQASNSGRLGLREQVRDLVPITGARGGDEALGMRPKPSYQN